MKFIKRDGKYFSRPKPIAVRDPYIHNLAETASFIKEYLSSHPGCRVTVVGDYDVDGITATAILYWAFAKLGITAVLRLPHRFSEGFGLSEKIIDEVPDGLLVTVDNGIAASAAVKKAKEKGLAVVVTDHHMPPIDEGGNIILPPADIILNPHVEPEKSEFTDYCGAAIAYRLAKELFDGKEFYSLLSLASLATVTDVMPLYGANWALVRDGLACINRRKVVPGLGVLLDRLGMDDHISEEDYGFKIGPVCNASGRLYDNGAERVLKLLMAKKNDRTSEYKAGLIVETNEKRKEIVKTSMEIALKKAGGIRPVIVEDDSFHEGVIGIIAGQLSETYQCPAIVFTRSSDPEILKGSGRSIPGIDLKDILDSIQDKIVRYGGHAGAAGLSIKADMLNEFAEAFDFAVGELPEIQDDVAYYDEELDVSGLEAAVQKMSAYAPFGEGNPQPVFHMVYTTEGESRRIGDGSSFMIKDRQITFMGFGLAEEYERLGNPKTIEVAGHLKEHWFKGWKSYQFEVTAIGVPYHL